MPLKCTSIGCGGEQWDQYSTWQKAQRYAFTGTVVSNMTWTLVPRCSIVTSLMQSSAQPVGGGVGARSSGGGETGTRSAGGGVAWPMPPLPPVPNGGRPGPFD